MPVTGRRRTMRVKAWLVPSCAASRVATGLMLALAGAACDDGPGGGDGLERATSRGVPASTTPAAGPVAADGADKEKSAAAVVYRDEDFVESIKNRDPFRSYTTAFEAKPPEDTQRMVIMPTTSIEEMQLIAIVMGTPRPKAMLLDPMQVGHVVERGNYIGRPKIIQATGSVSMTLNWRVERIRENEVVLTQQDPTDPTRTSLTKIIPLREEVAKLQAR